ncbi:MAG: FKBP-type peptidyl-prolyl cis-trans isomerase [Clostridia bacterium]|nr:FKBP-type peptidyl-prolyl cis-trans isomerase [Clostridia bacterium]
MKKIIGIFVVTALVMSVVCGCGGKKAKRELYNENLAKYVTLGEYKNIKVDTASSDFKSAYEATVENDVALHNLYEKKTTGEVVSGDTVNIDYVGKKDGVAFDGGTAQGYDLTIGSGSFIPGFEDGLIGKKIGSTVDLNLTFPESYQSEELAGKAVVFTVTINYVTTTNPLKPEEFYKELGFQSAEDYTKDATKRTVIETLVDQVNETTKAKDYPEADEKLLYESMKKQYEQMYQAQYGATFEQMLSYSNMTEDDFKKTALENTIYPTMKKQMALYAVLDQEKIELTDKAIEAQVKKTIQNIGRDVTEEKVKEFYGDYYFEALAVEDLVGNFLYENAKIK